jgi:hypothetical protein
VSASRTACHRTVSVTSAEHVKQPGAERPRIARKCPGKQAAEAFGRHLLGIVGYDRCCRIGGSFSLDDLAETAEFGDWKGGEGRRTSRLTGHTRRPKAGRSSRGISLRRVITVRACCWGNRPLPQPLQRLGKFPGWGNGG